MSDKNGHLFNEVQNGLKIPKSSYIKNEKCLALSQAAIHWFHSAAEEISTKEFCRILCQKLETQCTFFFQDPKKSQSLCRLMRDSIVHSENVKRIVLQWKTKSPVSTMVPLLFILLVLFLLAFSVFSRSKMMISWLVASSACPLQVKSSPSVMDLPTSSLQPSILLSTTSGISLLVFRYIFLTFHRSIQANYPSANDSQRARWLF